MIHELTKASVLSCVSKRQQMFCKRLASGRMPWQNRTPPPPPTSPSRPKYQHEHLDLSPEPKPTEEEVGLSAILKLLNNLQMISRSLFVGFVTSIILLGTFQFQNILTSILN
jgi:hypothetical protein